MTSPPPARPPGDLPLLQIRSGPPADDDAGAGEAGRERAEDGVHSARDPAGLGEPRPAGPLRRTEQDGAVEQRRAAPGLAQVDREDDAHLQGRVTKGLDGIR